jgi:hypothetical protein
MTPMPPRAIALVAALLAVVGLVAVTRGGDPAPPPEAAPATAVPPAPSEPLPVLSVTAAELHGPAGVGPLPDDVHAAVHGVVFRYLRDAVLTPMRDGAPGPGLDHIATDVARARLLGPDRAALLDEGLPPSEAVVADRAEARLTGLAGHDGAPAIVVATVEIDAHGDGDGRPTVQRRGELVLVPAGAGWLIDGYTMSVTRTAGDLTTAGAASTEATS